MFISAPTRINVKSSEVLNIACESPFPVTNCYLRTPNNTLNYMSNADFEQTQHLGLCIFQQLPKIHGQYICGFNTFDPVTQTNYADVQRYYDVHIYDRKLGEILEETIIIKQGEPTNILCKTADNLVIENCGFVAPNGNVITFNINSNKTDARGYAYHGSGYHMGECGITISNVKSRDFGKWKCQYFLPSASLKEAISFDVWLIEKRK